MSLIVRGPVLLAACEGDGVGGDAADAMDGEVRFWSRERMAESTGRVSTVSAEKPSIVEEG